MNYTWVNFDCAMNANKEPKILAKIPKYHILPLAPVSVSSIIIAVRPTNISMITVAMMLISSTVIIMVRYMDIIGLSSSIQLSLIIDCGGDQGSAEAHGPRARLFAPKWQADLSHMT